MENGIYYFFDKNLPFGSSISCAVFKSFSDALAHITKFVNQKENVNYLDDFLFLDEMIRRCNGQLQNFLEICEFINFPVSSEKTEFAKKCIFFLGLLTLQELQNFVPFSKDVGHLFNVNIH